MGSRRVCGRPVRCKKFFEVLRVVEVLTCVRPTDAAFPTPLASMEYADQVQIVSAGCKRPSPFLVFLAPSYRPLRHTSC
jgi:hypothetical protein